MPLSAPVLDDRTFQQLVDEAKKRIPHYTKDWTDHNVSDPGVTLIELFAWLTETTLYRLNRVPDRHYIKFMEMLGLTLKPPVPAKVPVTFWLSSAAEKEIVIPGGTEVASTQTETQQSIVFTTDDDFTIHPPELEAVFSRVAGSGNKPKRYTDPQVLRHLTAGLRGVFEVFSATPQIDDALYFGFANDLGNHILRFEMEWTTAGGAGIDPTLPPIVWEASTGENERRWLPCEVEVDSTNGLNTNGRVQLHLPKMGRYSVNKKNLYWLRVRVRDITSAEKREGMRPYENSPGLKKLAVASWGGRTPATHSQTVKNEMLGQSDGSAGQKFYLKNTPLLSRQEGEHLLVSVAGEETQTWTEVKDFADSNYDSRHYVLESVTGELRFGPSIRQPNGDIKLYGAIPPRASNLRFSQYRFGGGDEGNVDTGVLDTLKTAIPYINEVRNREPAWGGLDAETLEDAKVRVPKIMRHRDRAVTVEDFEDLALQTPNVSIGRVKCLQPLPSDTGQVVPGQVYVLIVPRVRKPEQYLSPEQLENKEGDIERLTAYLNERRLLTTRLFISSPAYRWVAARVQLRASMDVDPEVVEQETLARLYRFLNPLTGGQDGKGWPFGRELYLSDVYQSLQGMANVQFIRSVELYETEPGGGPEGDTKESVTVLRHGVIVSGRHEVEFV